MHRPAKPVETPGRARAFTRVRRLEKGGNAGLRAAGNEGAARGTHLWKPKSCADCTQRLPIPGTTRALDIRVQDGGLALGQDRPSHVHARHGPSSLSCESQHGQRAEQEASAATVEPRRRRSHASLCPKQSEKLRLVHAGHAQARCCLRALKSRFEQTNQFVHKRLEARRSRLEIRPTHRGRLSGQVEEVWQCAGRGREEVRGERCSLARRKEVEIVGGRRVRLRRTRCRRGDRSGFHRAAPGGPAENLLQAQPGGRLTRLLLQVLQQAPQLAFASVCLVR